MNLDFTGERIIPGKVDAHLYNEHLVRYLFAAPLGTRRRCLDLGCGSGYGTAELAGSAESVTAIDIAFEPVKEARKRYTTSVIRWCQASVTALPFRDASFDLITAFEVIEHLANWKDLLAEAARVLSPEGLFVVSTPNRAAYAELRGSAGPNPFHVHEFEPEGFRSALLEAFPRVQMWSQWSTEANVIAGPYSRDLEITSELQALPAAEAVYLLGVAGKEHSRFPQAGVAHVSAEGNLLLERLRHIHRLEGEVAQKDSWLQESQAAHLSLLNEHRKVLGELEQSNAWASKLDTELKASENRVVALQEEVEEHQRNAAALQNAFEHVQAQLESQTDQLARCVDLLHQTEAHLNERTLWAQGLDSEVNQLRALLENAKQSRWVRLGRRLSLGPRLP